MCCVRFQTTLDPIVHYPIVKILGHLQQLFFILQTLWKCTGCKEHLYKDDVHLLNNNLGVS
jgi:hypothetical protein